MRTKIFIAAIAGAALFGALAAAQPFGPAGVSPLGDYDIFANATHGKLKLRQAQTGGGHLSGNVFGEPLTGYRASQQAAWIRWRGKAPLQAYVGQFNRNSRQWRGAFYAFSSAGGASSAQNAWGFQARDPNVPQPAAWPANVAPQPPSPLGSASPGVWEGRANGFPGLYFAIHPDGSVMGAFDADAIGGHHADATKSVAFVRLRGAAATQFYAGHVLPPPNAGRPGLIRGRFYALDEASGGASRADMEFDFEASRLSGFFRLRLGAANAPLTNLCVAIVNGARSDGALLALAPCSTASTQKFGLLDYPAAILDPRPDHFLVSAHSGRCMGAPAGAATGTQAQVNACGSTQARRLFWPLPGRAGNVLLAGAAPTICLAADAAAAGAAVRIQDCNAPNLLKQFTLAETP